MSGALDHSPADVARQLLVDLGLGTAPSANGAWPVYATRGPDTPDSMIVTHDTTPRLQGRFHTSGQTQEAYGVQVSVRDANHADGFAKINDIAVALDESVLNDIVAVGAAEYIVYSIARVNGPLAAGKGLTDKRNLFTLNVLVSMKQNS